MGRGRRLLFLAASGLAGAPLTSSQTKPQAAAAAGAATQPPEVALETGHSSGLQTVLSGFGLVPVRMLTRVLAWNLESSGDFNEPF